MRISRFSKIKKHKIFRDFVWPEGLPAFAQFNVIYGWNGTGKTTLSSLFTHLQDGRAISQGEVDFELEGGGKISGASIPSAALPPVRVFNRDFVSLTIDSIGQSNVAPIYFLGTESIEQQKQVEKLKIELEKAQESVTKADSDKRKADKSLDDYCIERARLIKEALLGSGEHTNYDKRGFKLAAVKLKGVSTQPVALSEEQKKSLRKQKDLKAKPSIPRLTVALPDTEKLLSQTSALLEETIVSKVIDELANDVAVSNWVQRGLTLHAGDRETDACRFCGNKLFSQRRVELAAHFNDAFSVFQGNIEEFLGEIESQQQILQRISFPDESRYYDHLVRDYLPAIAAAEKAIAFESQVLLRLKEALEHKKTVPFEAHNLEGRRTLMASDHNSLQDAICEVNNLIDKHEAITINLNDEVKKACRALEQDYVLESLTKFDELSSAVEMAKTAHAAAKKKPTNLNEQIDAIEREIVEHRRPAEELNSELHAYLGRDELQFEVKETGYALTRGGQPAHHLSEGERTAIAFLYFLKSLEDKAFDLSKGIVVIDDPVSSLDANALFSAFGYMKERTRTSFQLFILTHNFAFFRQVKNWFHHLPGQKKKDIEKRSARFYTLLAVLSDGERSATIATVDRLLEEFESEYHFLFKQVYDVANNAAPVAGLGQFYGVPNIARRLIETFLAYRYPDCSGDLIKRLERAEFDSSKKIRILRLLNTYSHSIGISDPEHDPTILAETQEVMKTILEFFQVLDDTHYQGMVKLMEPLELEG